MFLQHLAREGPKKGLTTGPSARSGINGVRPTGETGETADGSTPGWSALLLGMDGQGKTPEIGNPPGQAIDRGCPEPRSAKLEGIFREYNLWTSSPVTPLLGTGAERGCAQRY